MEKLDWDDRIDTERLDKICNMTDEEFQAYCEKLKQESKE